ncbi:MAG: MarR family winged helix-turn-helix transcriptional regulator [Gaiellaceae bacterium]
MLQPHVVDQLVGRLIQRIVEGSGVTGPEYALTSWLNAVGSATPSDLADGLGMSATTLSAIIDRLVRKGEVRRVPNRDDGRSYLLEPTAQGKATNARNGARFMVEIDALRANLAGDPEEILASMRLLEDALRKTIADQKP